MPLDEAQQAEREDFIQGLRDLADWYEASTEVKAPWYHSVSIYLHTKEEAADVARTSKGGITKVYTEGNLELKKEFGDTVRFRASASRNDVCEAKVVGKRTVKKPDYSAPVPEIEVEEDIIEWECKPLLED